MKKIKLFLVFFLFLSLSFYSEAQTHSAKRIKGNVHHNGRGRHHRGGRGNPVGAPLDGGLLTILGVGGVTYYLLRKNKTRNPAA